MARYSWQAMVTAEVLPRLPELRLTRAVLHTQDVDWLLCAAIEIRSLFSRAFTVEVIVMPLYVPADHVRWLVGDRLGRLTSPHDRWWDPATTDTAAIGAEIAEGLRGGALAYWDRFGDLASFAAECRRRSTFAISPHYLEWVVGAAVVTGDDGAASEAFAAARRLPPGRPWEHASRARIARVEQAWRTDRLAAVALLGAARDRTSTALGLAPRGAEHPS